MKKVIFYRDDFRNDDLGMTFDCILDALGIKTDDGFEIEAVSISVTSATIVATGPVDE